MGERFACYIFTAKGTRVWVYGPYSTLSDAGGAIDKIISSPTGEGPQPRCVYGGDARGKTKAAVERAISVKVRHDAGEGTAEIAVSLGVSRARVRQLIQRGGRIQAWRAAHPKDKLVVNVI